MAYGTVNADVIQSSVANTSLGAGNASIMKNRIINGAMVVAQRTTSAVTTDDSYPVDRMNIAFSTDGAFSAIQSSTAPAGFTNSLLWTTTTADASLSATQRALIIQNIEGYNVGDLAFGTADAKTVTLSFWVRSSLTGTFGGSLANSAQNRSYPFTYTISSANTWEQKSITIAGDTTGTWLTTNGLGLRVRFSMGVGSSYLGTAGSWAGADYRGATGETNVMGTLNATWYVTGVQLEVGSSATGYEYRQYGTELQLCQRYLFAIKASENSDTYCRYTSGECVSSTDYNSTFVLPVRMRTTPTLTTTGTASNYAIYSRAAVTVCNAVPGIGAGNPQTVVVSTSVASGLTLGSAAQLLSAFNNTSYLYFGAEL